MRVILERKREKEWARERREQGAQEIREEEKNEHASRDKSATADNREREKNQTPSAPLSLVRKKQGLIQACRETTVEREITSVKKDRFCSRSLRFFLDRADAAPPRSSASLAVLLASHTPLAHPIPPPRSCSLPPCQKKHFDHASPRSDWIGGRAAPGTMEKIGPLTPGPPASTSPSRGGGPSSSTSARPSTIHGCCSASAADRRRAGSTTSSCRMRSLALFLLLFLV